MSNALATAADISQPNGVTPAFAAMWDDAELLPDSSVPVVEKDALIGVPMIITDWRFHKSSYNEEDQYIFVEVLTADGVQVGFVDGGTGIRRQINEHEQRHRDTNGDVDKRPIRCPQGLRKSEYEYKPTPRSKAIPAVTYYIA